MVDLTALRSARPDLLDQAAGAWSRLGNDFGKQAAALRSDVVEPLFGASTWAGAAADAASANLSDLSSHLATTDDDASVMATLLRDAAAGVRDAQSVLRAAENMAAQYRLTIGPDGSVSPATPAPLTGPQQPLPGEAPSPAAADVADLVRRALAVASEVDAQITARLKQVQAFPAAPPKNLLNAGQLAGVFDRAMIPPTGTDPAEVNSWWKALSHAQQQALIHEAPGQIGWLDGVPAVARDQANRIALAGDKQKLQGQLASLLAHEPPKTMPGGGRFGTQQMPNPVWQQWHDQVAQIQGRLAGISAVESGLAIGGKDGYPPAYLLGFDTNGNGHAIVSFGNPDNAQTTVTYVPGLGSKITGAYRDSGRAAALWQQAEKFSPGKTIASVYWLGYDAPQLGLSQGIHNLDVTSTSDAIAGASALTRFQNGLAVTHASGVPGHTVVLGHSYGSLVVGEAAAHDGMHPNDLIFVGSPGVGVNHASQLGVSPAHVWAGANANDPVPDLPPANPAHWIDNYSSHFGNDPTSPQFGGKDFAANYDPGKPSGFDPAYYVTLKAHSGYWDPDSASLLNMAHIVDGQYGKVMTIHLPVPHPAPGSPAVPPAAAGSGAPVPRPTPQPSPAAGGG
jgi:Alpha/beta hydrolase